MKLKKPKIKVKLETRNFIISFFLTASITFILTFVPIWQLIIIPGVIGGLFNKKMRRGIYSAALGVSIVWILYMVYYIAEENAYMNLDHFAGLIFGDLGYGWVIFILILLVGILLGALGGAIGSGIMILLGPRLFPKLFESEPSVNIEKNPKP